jgi:hypothetical protein
MTNADKYRLNTLGLDPLVNKEKMMQLTMVFKMGPMNRPKTIHVELSEELTLTQLKKLWEFEQFLNSLPGCPLRAHINVESN